MSRHDLEYATMVHKVLSRGKLRGDRTGTGTMSIFSHQMLFDMDWGFPLLTTKNMRESFDHVVAEMLWMLKGSTNANELADMGFGIWRKWAKDSSGDLGPVYGHGWRNFGGEYVSSIQPTPILPDGIEATYLGIANGSVSRKHLVSVVDKESNLKRGVDQISWVINELKTNPESRRMVVSAWNPNQLEQMALPPCHWAFELYVEDSRLNMKLHQRSCDVFLGVPYNIAEYALLLHMISHVTGYAPGMLVHDMTNVHIYNNHLEQMREQLTRDCSAYAAPRLRINRVVTDIFDFKVDDFSLEDYRSFPKLTGKVSV